MTCVQRLQDEGAPYIRAKYPTAIEQPERFTPTSKAFELASEHGDGPKNFEDSNEVEDLNALFVADLDSD